MKPIKKLKDWMDHRGVTPKDLGMMAAAMIPLTVFVVVMVAGFIGSLTQ